MSRSGTLSVAYFIANPTLTSVTPTGGVAGSYTYKIVYVAPDGTTTAASAGVSDTAGPTTLDVSHYETLVWTEPVGNAAPSFVDIYRTSGGTSQGKIARIAGGIGTFNDTGLAGDSATAPTSNTTGVGSPSPVADLSDLTATVTGTMTATAKIQGKIDPGGWVDIATSIAAGTAYNLSSSMPTVSQVRFVITAYTSGTPVVVVGGHSNH